MPCIPALYSTYSTSAFRDFLALFIEKILFLYRRVAVIEIFASKMDLFSFPAMVLYLTTYFVVERLIKKTFQHLHPEIYDKLYRDRKDLQYFAFMMGILITLFSVPACYKALRNSSDANDVLGNPHSSVAGQVCMASRGVLWASEFNRLDHSSKYISHHLASLGYLVYHLQAGLPLRIIYAFYASLITELFSDTACLVTLHGLKPESSKLAYRVQAANWFLLVLIRLPPSVYAATFLLMHGITDPVFWVNAACLFIYTRFNMNIIINVAKRLEIVKFVDTQPAFLRVVQRFNVSLYGFFFSIASFIGAALMSELYIQNSPTKLHSNEVSRLNLQLLVTGLAAFVGARVPSVLSHHGVKAVFSQKTFSTRGLWIQGAILAAVLSVAISPLVDRYRLFLCLVMVLPAGEAIGRVGCYFAGCCGDHTARRISIQLLSVIFNAAAGISVLILHTFAYITQEIAAILALASNALIRVMLRPNAFAMAQLMAAMAMLTLRIPPKVPITAPGNFGTFRGDWNETGAEQWSFSGTDSKTEVDFGMLKSPWTALLALSSIVAGSFVQGCGDSASARGCSNAPLSQGRSDALSVQGCGDSPALIQGCSENLSVQGCGDSPALTQGCSEDLSV